MKRRESLKILGSSYTRLIHTRIIPALSLWQWWVVAIITIVGSQLTMSWLNGQYAETLFPVPFYIGQTAFSGETIKGYYAAITELGTFGKYVWVQIADFLYMFTVYISMACATVAVYVSLPEVKFLKTMGAAMIVIAPMAAVSDAFENFVSFYMLANPTDFTNWVAILYSSFAVLKFLIYLLAYTWLTVGIISILTIWLFKLVKRNSGEHIKDA